MKELLETLDALLKEKRPEYYATLQDGLGEDELAEYEKKLALKLPEDLKDLYRWKNGQTGYKSFLENQMFEPLEDVVEGREILNELLELREDHFAIKNFWNENWLPVFADGGGSHICYDLEGTFTGVKGQMLEYWKNDLDRDVIANSLSDLLAQLIEYLQDNEKETIDKDEFIEIDMPDGFPKEFWVTAPEN